MLHCSCSCRRRGRIVNGLITSAGKKLGPLAVPARRRLAPACARRPPAPLLAAPTPAKVVPFYSGPNMKIPKCYRPEEIAPERSGSRDQLRELLARSTS